jgi:hypothetical protein
MPLNDVPQANQTLGVTQPLIRTNFSTIDTAFAVDHVDYNLSNQGKHNQVTFPVQSLTPPFLANEFLLYNKQSTFSKELFVHKLIGYGSGTTEIPFTESTLSVTAPAPGAGAGGWTKLPSGMIIITGSGNGTGYTTVSIIQPALTQILMVVVSPFTLINGGSPTDPNTAATLAGIGGAATPALAANQFAVYVSNRTTSGAVSAGFSFIALAYL